MHLSRFRSLCVAVLLLICAAFPAFGQRASQQKVNEWTRLLRADDPQKRSSAATSLLGTDDEKALKALLDALQPDQPETVRVSVITAFGVKGDDRACPLIIAALGDPTDSVRQAAKAALGSINTSESVRLLLQAAADPKRPVLIRVQALSILGDLRPTEAIEALIGLLGDGEEAVRTAARNALESITFRRFSTVQQWVEWWQHSHNMTREEMLRELVQFQTDRNRTLSGMVERLYLRLLNDPKNSNDAALLIEALTQSDSVAVKKLAIKELSALRGKLVLTALTDALGDPEASVRQAAADALVAQADPAAIPPLLKALRDAEGPVRAAAARALAALKAKEAVPALRTMMLSDTSGEAAEAAARALGELADPAALDSLIKAVMTPTTPANVYEAAASALAKIKDPRAVPTLVTLLQSPKENVRWGSVDALGGLRAGEAVKPLSPLALKDPNPQVREAALAALSKIGDPAALETLVEALGDDQKRVSDQALRSLTQLAETDPSLYEPALDQLLSARRYALAERVLTAAAEQLGTNPNNAAAITGLRARLAAGLIAAKEWPRARPHLETLVAKSPKEVRYVKDLALCLLNQPDYDGLFALLAQTRRASPELSEWSWQETVRAAEQIAAGSDAKKVVAVVDALEKESPEMGGPVTAQELRDLRSRAKGEPQLPASAPAPASTPVAAPG